MGTDSTILEMDHVLVGIIGEFLCLNVLIELMIILFTVHSRNQFGAESLTTSTILHIGFPPREFELDLHSQTFMNLWNGTFL